MTDRELRIELNRHTKEMRQMLDDFLLGQKQAMARLSKAVAAATGSDALERHLRAEINALPSPYAESLHPSCEALLTAMWEAVRPPTARR